MYSANLDPTSTETLRAIFPTCFLTGEAYDYYEESIKSRAHNMEDAVSMLENHFVAPRSYRMNDALWNALTFGTVKQKLSYDGTNVTNESITQELINEVMNLHSIRSLKSDDSTVMNKLISAVEYVPFFNHLCRYSPNNLSDLKVDLREVAKREDQLNAKKSSDYSAFKAQDPDDGVSQDDDTAWYVDCQMHGKRDRPIRGFGRPRSSSPIVICVICNQPNCRNPSHRKRLQSFLAQMAQTYTATSTQDDGD